MTLTIELPAEQIDALKWKATAEGVSIEQCAGKLLKRALADAAKPPLSERIRGIWAEMPDAVRAKLPSDGASQHDHYNYGVPKRER
jgi:hypothetical protein